MPIQPKLRLEKQFLPDFGKWRPGDASLWVAARALAAAFVLALATASVAAIAATPPQLPRAPEAIRADLLYHNYCSVCHGDRGDGRSRAQSSLVPPPRDFTTPRALAELNRETMIVITASGKPGTAMVGWSTQLKPKEIEAVVDYIVDTFMKPRATPEFAEGRALYAGNCSVCHGDNGRGARFGARMATPPRDFGTPQARAELTRERMIAAVTHGKPGTPMAAFDRQLSAAQIGLVVDFVRIAYMGASPADASGTSAHYGRAAAGVARPAGASGQVPAFPGAVPTPTVPSAHASAASQTPPSTSTPSAAPLARADMTLPFAKGLVGDPARGRKFYDENCATCHGVKGDAQGPRAYFIRPKPRNFLTEESRATYNRPAIFAGVSRGRLGSEMPAWSKVIDDQMIADVSEYVLRAFIVGESKSVAGATPAAPRGGQRR